MDDKLKEIMDHYELDVQRLFRVRGAYVFDTDKGFRILREFRLSDQKAEMAQKVKQHLVDCGYENVDTYEKNKEGLWITENGMGTRYVLKRWFQGEDCDLKQSEHIERITSNLAKLHLLLKNVTEEPLVFQADTYEETIIRHNRELRRVRAYMREKKQRNEFELMFLSMFPEFYQEADKAEGMLDMVDCKKLYEKMEQEQAICHGNYNYHNIILLKNGEATSDFERVHMQLQCMDLYDILRKIMEKNNWNMAVFDRAMEGYEKYRPLSKEERKVLLIRMAVPEKFWKIANYYYNSKKTWMSAKNIEKLQNLQHQKQQRLQFLQKLPGALGI